MNKARRTFIRTISVAGAGIALSNNLASALHHANANQIACQQYTWFSYFRRDGLQWNHNNAESWKSFLDAGFRGYEPSFNSEHEVSQFSVQSATYGIWSRSMYLNSSLHEPELVEKSMDEVLEIARAAHTSGIRIVVTNPVPIRWGGLENKSDEQLTTQSLALNVLGKRLKSIGMTLAYHNHDAEMREGAREFHHMLMGTDPEFVKLCLDPHWIFRGSGNSEVALFDIVEMYADRVVEVHLRQSENGIWSEVFGEGDIDYDRLNKVLKKKGIHPLIVLEQAVEEGTPHTMPAVQAIAKSLNFASRIFKS